MSSPTDDASALPAEKPEAAPAPSSAPPPPPATVGMLGLIQQVGVIEFGLSALLIGVGLWALVTDKYDERLSLFLGGGFVGAWVLGAVVRWLVGREK